MKKIIVFLSCAMLLLALPLTAYASDNGGDGVTITVVIPNTPKESATPAPAPMNPAKYLYPSSVWEGMENGRREIIRTYELAAHEKPEDISRESFTREGWLFELADITRKETASVDAREHTETVNIDSATNDMSAVLALLAPTLEHQSEDGHIGVLHLDIASITIETAGTRSSSYTVSATREYPHLSSNDTSLVPKTITDGGRTLTLEGINWRTQNTVTVDYEQIPDSYTAVATYTGTASRTTVTGYTVTAEYSGTIAKVLTGRTVYTAYFIGIPIVTPVMTSPAPTPTPEAPEALVEEEPATPCETEALIETEAPSETEPPAETDEKQKSNHLPLFVLVSLIAGAGIGGCFAYMYSLKNKNQKEVNPPHEEDNEETV